MDSKTDKVSMWLSKIFGDQQIPFYEVNPWSMDVLYRLMERNETRDRDTMQLIEDVKQKTVEYKSDADYMQDFIMESVGLSSTSLSSNGSSCLKNLVDSSLALDLKDTSQTSFVLAINDLTSDRTAAENRSQTLVISDLMKKLTEAIVLEKSLEKDLLTTDSNLIEAKAKAECKKQNADFFIKKMNEWNQLSQSLENDLKQVGFDASLDHQSLVELSERLENVKKEVESLNAKLNSYLNLTPNVYSAKVKIEETKLELNKVDRLLSEKMDDLRCASPELNLLK
ncbi:HAUS augmin-like complex subunit 1 isoform X1 [Carcharodon carcharias]|uniref:HAUS augmin-like complex subunit 1 isoform X1 n=2 Tax=Carcharodon carcharias TaxID=13397 RepID=UPI001B7EE64A|nr:HAUS augmin-like complex subunit 1 isoform X1 [Carcharodon carcharias]